MRSIVKEMTANLTAQEYLDSQAFLDRLAAEARDRLEKADAEEVDSLRLQPEVPQHDAEHVGIV